MFRKGCLLFTCCAALVAAQTSPVGQAFTATVLHRYFGDDITQPATVEIDIIGKRADGSMAEVKQVIDGKVIGNKSILDLVSRKRIAVQVAGGSMTTYPLSEKTVARYRKAKACNTGVPADKLLGFDVVKVTRSEPKDSVGHIVHTQEWDAPALGCFPLKAEDDLYVSGSEKPAAVTTTEVLSINKGEPSAQLFAVPSGLTERSPSEAIREAAQATGRACTKCALHMAQTLDRAYFHAQANQR